MYTQVMQFNCVFFFLWIYCSGYMDGNSSRHENEHEAGARRCHIQRTPVGEKLAALVTREEVGGRTSRGCGNGTLFLS